MESAASSLNKSMLSFLPTMGAGEALLMGVDFSMPLLLKITPPVKTPRSETPILKEMIFGCNKGCKSRNSLIYTLVCGERGSGLLYKIIKDLYQIISNLSERQVVTDII